MNSTIERITLPKGVQLTRIELRNKHNRWCGNIILEYGVKASKDILGWETWGRYYSITDWGNFSYAWYFVGAKRFEDFIRECAEDAAVGSEYILKKLCPEECDVFLLEESITKARALLEEADNDGEISPEDYEYCSEKLDNVSSEQELCDWYIDDFGDPDGYESFVHGLSYRACGYRDNVLPLLAEVLRNG